MRGPEAREERRDPRVTNGLFWGGVGLAPLAALLLLLGQEGGALRFAAVLTILAVVLIGLSITLRGNSDTMRVEIEEALYEEIDSLRSDVREDIGTAARATHKAFGEKLQVIYDQLNAVRAQLDAVRAETGRVGVERPQSASVSSHAAAAGAIGPAVGVNGRATATGGVVRHTETVQVTTRQTIVDPPSQDDGRSGTVYGGGAVYGRQGDTDEPGWSDQRSRGEGRRRAYERDDEPAYEDRWSDVRAGDRWGAVREDDRGREVRVGERRAAMHADESGTELRYQDRWAEVRQDEPRRASRREERESWRDERESWREPQDGWQTGREGWRDERASWGGDRANGARDDRDGWRDEQPSWREEQPSWRAEQSGWRAEESTGWRAEESTGWSGGRRAEREESGRAVTGGGQQRRAIAALPAGGQPSGIWDGEWAEPERQPVGRRRRDDDEGYSRGNDEAAGYRQDRWR